MKLWRLARRLPAGTAARQESKTANLPARERAIGELKKFPNALLQIYDAPEPQGARIPAAARAEGLEKPAKPK
jgi:hypothetical protein